MALFNIPQRSSRADDAKIAQKTKTRNNTPAIKVNDSGGISGRIASIRAMVERHLGKFADESILIRDEKSYHDYISNAIENGVIAIDTETTGLDPMLDDIVGLCIYTPNEKTAYIPINHISYITQEKVADQLSKEVVARELERLKDTKIIMFNAKFDIRVIRNQLGVYLKCYWDCYLAARLLNENEGDGNNGLKPLHQKYVLDGKEDAFSFGSLFNGIPFSLIPINTGYLYAAHDAIITYELYEYQKQYLYYEPDCSPTDRNGLNGVSWVFFNIEMPVVETVVEMEDNGIMFDFDYNAELSVKYNQLLEEKLKSFYDVCDSVADDIETYKAMHTDNKLDNPINIGSSQQIAVLLYDILKIPPPDKKNPRGTGVEILSQIDHPICKAILGFREMSKLISTYIDKLPNCVNPNDGRVHCNFHAYGAATGRFSSSDPKSYWAYV